MATRPNEQVQKALTGKGGFQLPGIASDIAKFVFGGDSPDISSLIAPVGGMARIGKSGSKFIDLFVGKEGRIFDTDPIGNRSGTHMKFVKDKFKQTMEKFFQEGGVRGSESGLEFAVDASGKPIPGKQTLDRSIQTILRAYNEKGFPGFDEEVMVDKILPSGKRKSSVLTMEQLLKRFF